MIGRDLETVDKNAKIVIGLLESGDLPPLQKKLAEGIRSLGYKNVNLIPKPEVKPEVDRAYLQIVWGHRQTHIQSHQERTRGKYLVMEHGFLRERREWVSLGYDSINGLADFQNKDITSLDRWNKHFSDLLKPWKTDSLKTGEYALVVGQTSHDVAVYPFHINRWYTSVVRSLNKKNIPVVFRPHPMERRGQWGDISLTYEIDKNEDAQVTIEKAKFIVTYSSNCGTLAACQGVPIVAVSPYSMVYNKLATHELAAPLIYPDREDWCAKIGYTQWSPDELASGEAFEFITRNI